MGLVKGAAALAGVALLAAGFGTPFLTVNSLVAAARGGDEAALERLVDFPAFRESLKDELTARLMTEARADPEVRDNLVNPGDVKRRDDQFAFVAAWEHSGAGQGPTLNREPLVYEEVKMSTRSYK